MRHLAQSRPLRCTERAAAAAMTGLLDLPPDVLRMIWRQRGSIYSGRPMECPAYCQALRSTCRAMRDATDAWISASWVNISAQARSSQDKGGQGVGSMEVLHPLEAAIEQLSRFPRDATMKKLLWMGRYGLDRSAGIWPLFLAKAQHRLHQLTSLTVYLEASVGRTLPSCSGVVCSAAVVTLATEWQRPVFGLPCAV